MTALLHDLRHAFRVFAKHRGATAVAWFTMTLAIGATTAIFSVVYGVLLRPLPYPAPNRLVAIWEVNNRGTYSRLADPNFYDFRDRNQSLAAMAKYRSYVTTVVGPGEPARVTVAVVTRDFFTVLGAQPARGRSFGPDDARLGAEPTAIVSHEYWARSLRSHPTLAGVHLRVGSVVYDVVGVMPAGFEFPADTELWLPAELDRPNTSRTSHNFQAIGRLRDGASVAQATADLDAIAGDIVRNSTERGDYLMVGATAVPLLTSLTGRVSSTLYVLLGAVCFLLLIACANVTNLLLAQAAARRRELAVRQALGAGRGRLLRQLAVESLVLLSMSYLAGLLVAALGVNVLVSLAPANLPRLDAVSMSWPVLTAAAGLTALVAIGLGLVTACRASGLAARGVLVDSGRASSQRVGRAIVAAQMALTVVLLTGAALLGRSLLHVLSVDPGFRTTGVIAMDVPTAYSEDPAVKARLAPLYASLLSRLRAIPGVEEVAATSAVPLDGGLPDGLFAKLSPGEVPERLEDLGPLFAQRERLGTADFCAVTPAYFRALGIPLLRGRLFDDRDGPSAPHAAVISESLARASWPDADPLGRTIEFGNMDGDLRPLTIVGIVGDTHLTTLEQPPRPTVFVNLLQRPRFSVTVVMRPSGNPDQTFAPARAALKSVAPDVPPRFRTFDEIYAASLSPRRFTLTLAAVFASTALVLAMAGVYGVMAYGVVQRRKEIGVWVALGATPGRVFRTIIGEGLLTTVVGVTIGLLGSLALTRALEYLLFGVRPADPVTLASVVGGLLGVAALASYLPARRATRVDPLEALRQD